MSYCQGHSNMFDDIFVFARSWLYQRRFLRPRSHFSAFFELYVFSFAPFQIYRIFQTLLHRFLQQKNSENRQNGRPSYREPESRRPGRSSLGVPTGSGRPLGAGAVLPRDAERVRGAVRLPDGLRLLRLHRRRSFVRWRLWEQMD